MDSCSTSSEDNDFTVLSDTEEIVFEEVEMISTEDETVEMEKKKKSKKKKKKSKKKKQKQTKKSEDSETEENENENEMVSMEDESVEIDNGKKAKKKKNKNSKKKRKKKTKKSDDLEMENGNETEKSDDTENSEDYTCIDVKEGTEEYSMEDSYSFSFIEEEEGEESTNWLYIFIIAICIIGALAVFGYVIKNNFCGEKDQSMNADVEKEEIKDEAVPDKKQELCENALKIVRDKLPNTVSEEEINKLCDDFMGECDEDSAKMYIQQQYETFLRDVEEKKEKIKLEEKDTKKAEIENRYSKKLEESKEQTVQRVTEALTAIMEEAMNDNYAVNCEKQFESKVESTFYNLDLFQKDIQQFSQLVKTKLIKKFHQRKKEAMNEIKEYFELHYPEYRSTKIEEKFKKIRDEMKKYVISNVSEKIAYKVKEWEKNQNKEENQKNCLRKFNPCKKDLPNMSEEEYKKLTDGLVSTAIDQFKQVLQDYSLQDEYINNLKNKEFESSMQQKFDEEFQGKHEDLNRVHDNYTKSIKSSEKLWFYFIIIIFIAMFVILVIMILWATQSITQCCKPRYPAIIIICLAVLFFAGLCYYVKVIQKKQNKLRENYISEINKLYFPDDPNRSTYAHSQNYKLQLFFDPSIYIIQAKKKSIQAYN